MATTFPVLSCVADEIIKAALQNDQRLLLFGPPGIGKSTLTTEIAQQLEANQRDCHCISADPGSPGFGIPGVVALGRWQSNAWQVMKIEALCTLDAGRFRLPVIVAVKRLAEQAPEGVLLVDGPGVVRGNAGSELLLGLVEAAKIERILVLTQTDRPPLLFDELKAMCIPLYIVNANTKAIRPGRRTRARQRSLCWNDYLAQSVTRTIQIDEYNLLGTPPPTTIDSTWIGRQIALLKHNQTILLAEIIAKRDNVLSIRLPQACDDFDSLLIRDAQRKPDGLLETADPFITEQLEYIPPLQSLSVAPINGGPRIIGQVGAVNIDLLNGVFGDPLLHIQLRYQKRSLLFDLGEGNRLSSRIAHQVTDVFISHAHMDHISGFVSLMRSRIGEFPACRLYGPPGLAQHINGFIQAFLWDRVADRGPTFIIYELHGDQLLCFHIKVGISPCSQLSSQTVVNGIILQEADFKVRAITLDHNTPVLAYAYEPKAQINIRKDALLSRGLTPGKWLGELKQHVLSENFPASMSLPDGKVETIGTLARDLVLVSPGKKLVYATDFGDTAENRKQVVELAMNAHSFFCESAFLQEDQDHAERHKHLTTISCGEIATAAKVARLIPFHFSQRYSNDVQQIYDEIGSVCQQLVKPKSMQIFTASASHLNLDSENIDANQ